MALAVVAAGISGGGWTPATATRLLTGTGKIVSWFGIVLLVPWATFFVIGRVAQVSKQRRRRGPGRGLHAAGAVLLAGCSAGTSPAATAWTFSAVALLAGVYNLLPATGSRRKYVVRPVDDSETTRNAYSEPTHQRIRSRSSRSAAGPSARSGTPTTTCGSISSSPIKIPTDPQYVRNLQREGAAIHGLVHPNIVRAIGFDPYADPAYLTMEYVPGTSLRPLIRTAALAIDDVVAVMRQVLAGLELRAQRRHRSTGTSSPRTSSSTSRPPRRRLRRRRRGQGHRLRPRPAAAHRRRLDRLLRSRSTTPPGKEIAGTLDYMAPEQRARRRRRPPRRPLCLRRHALRNAHRRTPRRHRPAQRPEPRSRNTSTTSSSASYARLDKRFTSADEFLEAVASQPPADPARSP